MIELVLWVREVLLDDDDGLMMHHSIINIIH